MTAADQTSDSPLVLTDYFIPGLLAGQTAFVTGGSRGLGLVIARCFASLGASIAICGRSPEHLEAAQAEIESVGAEVATYQADVRNLPAIEDAFGECADRVGPASIVVCAAAGNFLTEARLMSSNAFRAVVEIDLLGTFHAAKAAFPQLSQTRGSLIFISAGQSTSPFALQSHVGAAKAGIDNLMRNLALEWGPYGIRANSIVPGPIEDSEGMRRLAQGSGPDVWNDSTALGRFTKPENIAAMAVVLASPLGRCITGARIAVDGGLDLSGFGLVNRAIYHPELTRPTAKETS
jgi:NAD(P)-dependent dehydrogenase (short-subunit alcohol dehydrogenase family)